MALFNILSLELILFIGILIAILTIRKKRVFSALLVKGLVTYIPPTDEDFQVLEKSD